MKRITGIKKITSVAGESVKAFVPYPLPPKNPTLQLTAELNELLQNAHLALDKLNLAGKMVPSLEWFIYAFVRREAVTSSQIEGTQATLIDLLTFEADKNQNSGKPADIEEVCNYLEALKYAHRQLKSKKGLPISLRLLNEMHRRLMRGVRGETKQPGAIRQSQNWIGGTRPGVAHFVPPPPQDLPQLISDFEKYIHTDDSLPALIRTGLLHVQFETIHPYLDGNGRIGRLLITLLLEHWKIIDQPLLYLSLYFKKNREVYYDHLGKVRTQGDWESWIKFFLKGVCQISQEAILLIGHLSQIVNEDRAKLLEDSSASIFALRLFELLPTHPIVTMPQVVKLLQTSKPTAIKAIGVLEKLKILTEQTGRKRDRMFEYSDYTGKLKFGTGLEMYRIVLNYAREDFVIKDGHVDYCDDREDFVIKDGRVKDYKGSEYDFFYDSKTEAETYYETVLKKLKGTPLISGALLEAYDSRSDKWRPLRDGLIWSDSADPIITAFASNMIKDKLRSLQKIIKNKKL